MVHSACLKILGHVNLTPNAPKAWSRLVKETARQMCGVIYALTVHSQTRKAPPPSASHGENRAHQDTDHSEDLFQIEIFTALNASRDQRTHSGVT